MTSSHWSHKSSGGIGCVIKTFATVVWSSEVCCYVIEIIVGVNVEVGRQAGGEVNACAKVLGGVEVFCVGGSRG